MAETDALIRAALESLPPKPPDDAPQPQKKRYSEQVSAALAVAIAQILRDRGMKGARPAGPGDVGLTGAERRMGGGIGAKRVDVSWATEESGLILGVSIKSINFKDRRTQNYQKNLINRRGDMLFEGVTLHRRFPFAVLLGFFVFDVGATQDGTTRRNATFTNAHQRLRLFSGRRDPAGRDEQYEAMYLATMDATARPATFDLEEAGRSSSISLDSIFDSAAELVVERNPDFYELRGGIIRQQPV